MTGAENGAELRELIRALFRFGPDAPPKPKRQLMFLLKPPVPKDS